ncbi:glycosyltransferase family 4 protein [Arthrobacter sp. ZBG10]|uniref:glycosyltransferase family 4 protein n=1 Tax=Arthrobacter sp. ZBG10 TaxID=1676590 RepID=UPI0018D04567|nr:glycosyltransferase family 4 protein [Arthrobacter sp. ZBG10]
MRSLASGTILYGYDSVLPAKRDLPHQSVWVAPNSLYEAESLGRALNSPVRNSVVYVGRLVSEKKVELLIRAFALADKTGLRLVIAGTGDQKQALQQLSVELGCASQVDFLGAVTDKNDLVDLYSRAVCAVSPGYAGLSLTQSLGFGVPVLVADDEPHAPEIELERFGGVTRFREDSAEALARAIQVECGDPIADLAGSELAHLVKSYYSAESMAAGLHNALLNIPAELDAQGWPARVK